MRVLKEPGSVLGIGTSLLAGRSGVPIPVWATGILFSSPKCRVYGPSSLLFNRYRCSLAGVKRPRREANHSSIEHRGYESLEPYI